jgi:hypothetical protein
MSVDEQITRGDLIGAFVSALGIIGGSFFTARKYYIHHFPFKMSFSDKPCNDSDATFSHSMTVPEGTTKDIFIRIRLREGRNLEVVTLRFVRRNLMKAKWENVPITIMEVKSIEDQEGTAALVIRSDQHGGQEGFFRQPRHIPKDGILWLKANIEAKGVFKGHLSFEQNRGDNYRGFVRCPVTVGKPPT